MDQATARSHYVIRGGDEGKRRLELVGRTLWPTTYRLLKHSYRSRLTVPCEPRATATGSRMF